MKNSRVIFALLFGALFVVTARADEPWRLPGTVSVACSDALIEQQLAGTAFVAACATAPTGAGLIPCGVTGAYYAWTTYKMIRDCAPPPPPPAPPVRRRGEYGWIEDWDWGPTVDAITDFNDWSSRLQVDPEISGN
jgi:hypothetical protein